MNREKKMIKAVIIAFLILLAPAFVMAQAIPTRRVNCDRGQSVQDVLDRLTGPAIIAVTGTCHEYLDLKKDDVTIQGGNYQEPSPPDPTQSIFYVLSARRVLITGVTVTGGSNGIYVDKGGSLTLDGNSTISGAINNGVASVFGSNVTVNSSTIQGNLRGVIAVDNSAIVVTNSRIQNNTAVGVLVARSSSARIGQNISGVQMKSWITGNTGSGVAVSRGSHAIVDGNDIMGNSNHGISVEGSSATVINNIISGNGGKGIVVSSSGNSRIGINDSALPGPNIIENNGYDGIMITNSAAAFMLANTIRFNGITTHRPGVGIYHANGELIGDNTIQGNGGHGVAVNQGGLFQGVGDWDLTPGPDIIQQNGYSGISGWNGASLDIRNVTVTNNTQNGIVLSLQSTLRIYDATVSDNHLKGIVLYDGSSVARYSTDSPRDSITGNLGGGIICYSGSNLVGVTSGVLGNSVVQVDCPPIYIP